MALHFFNTDSTVFMIPILSLKTRKIIKPLINQPGMEIKDIKARSGQIDIVFTVVSKEQPRTFEKFGKPGKVCNAKIKDASGEILLTLWNEQIEALEVGDKV